MAGLAFRWYVVMERVERADERVERHVERIEGLVPTSTTPAVIP
jgi:hypothetical protein